MPTKNPGEEKPEHVKALVSGLIIQIEAFRSRQNSIRLNEALLKNEKDEKERRRLTKLIQDAKILNREALRALNHLKPFLAEIPSS